MLPHLCSSSWLLDLVIHQILLRAPASASLVFCNPLEPRGGSGVGSSAFSVFSSLFPRCATSQLGPPSSACSSFFWRELFPCSPTLVVYLLPCHCPLLELSEMRVTCLVSTCLYEPHRLFGPYRRGRMSLVQHVPRSHSKFLAYTLSRVM